HYEREFGLSTFGSGILAGCYSGGMVFGILIAGLWLSDRFGVRRTAVAGCTMLALASVGFGAASSLPALELARLLQGIGAGLVWCSLLNWLILMVPAASRGTALGAAMGAGVFGMAVGPLLGIATQAVGTFAVFAAVAVAFGLYGLVLVREEAPPSAGPGRRQAARLRLPRDPQLRRAIALVTVPPLVAGAVITIVPLHLADLGATEIGIDAALLLGALLSAVCCIYAGSLADARGHLWPVRFGAVATAATLLTMTASDSVLVIALGFVLFESIGLGFFWIPLMSLFTERGESLGMDPATVALLLNLAITGAYALGPPLLTAVQESAGVSVTFLAMVGLTLLALGSLSVMRQPG
ncbi:MAG TPA: MFS transporter, partial [Solirubrobacterales bacterium]